MYYTNAKITLKYIKFVDVRCGTVKIIEESKEKLLILNLTMTFWK